MLYEIPGATGRHIGANGIELAVYEAGSGPAVVLCHGFPELAYSWRNQIGPLSDAGYHVLAPDQRGYGGTSAPESIAEYDMLHLCNDLVGLLDACDIERAVFVGHDWGGMVVWSMSLLHPDRVLGVVGVNTPYYPRGDMSHIDALHAGNLNDNYMLFFQEPGRAEAALDGAGVRVVIEKLMRQSVPLDAWGDNNINMMMRDLGNAPFVGDQLLTEDELDIFASTFGKTGFTGGLNWYRNMHRNWELTPELTGAKIDVPSLMICAEWDPVLSPALAQGMPDVIDDLEMNTIAACGHWTQQQKPKELNSIMLDWLERRFPSN